MATEKEFLKRGEGVTKITLTRPMSIAGAKVSVVTMREPLVRDQRAVGKSSGSDEEKELALMSNLCELTPDDIDSLPLRDYKRLQAALMDFIG
jgi:hypothetical protein